MTRCSGLRLAMVLFVAFVAIAAGGTAHAGSTATRCDERGCVHIHCNSTGDRCYRYEGSDEPRHAARATRCFDCENHEIYYRRGEGGAPRLLCDSDGDRCYPSWHHHWDYREYYRRLGYHWDNGPSE